MFRHTQAPKHLASATSRALEAVRPWSPASAQAEQEAEQVAQHVMSRPEPAASGTDALNARAIVSPPEVAGLSGGEPLSRAERASMEPRFGFDFGRVRIHSGPEASSAARAVGAHAFALGPHIVLGAAAQRGTPGEQLLAHELTHVVQQAGGAAPLGVSAAPLAVASTPEQDEAR